MKITGIIMAIIGVVLLLISGLMAMQAQDSRNISGMLAEDSGMTNRCIWLAAFGAASAVTGGLIMLYGGRGFTIDRNEPLERV